MNICVVSDSFPAPGRLEYVFVEQLCIQFAKMGNNVSVVAPQSLTKRILRRLPKLPFSRIENRGDTSFKVYSPQWLSLGNLGEKIAVIQRSRIRAITKAIKALEIKPDVIYCHFWHNGFCAYQVAKNLNIPIVVATGEAEITQRCNTEKEQNFCEYVKGIISVSSKNIQESKTLGLLKTNNYLILPNSVDQSIFKRRDKGLCRKELGYNQTDFIISFVGGLIERKGPIRVSEAISRLKDPSIKSIFIGANRDGDVQIPDCDGILHCGPVDHNEIPKYLNASDVFVLPTLHEGCCNAIVEAMNCGLPIISSNLPFNLDVLDKSNAFLIDPMNVDEIAEAIATLRNNKALLESMSKASLEKSKNLSLENRAFSIIEFIEKSIR